ncbi:hypothetical protein ACOSQ2_002595 [Xanthoceras sorbifolium]
MNIDEAVDCKTNEGATGSSLPSRTVRWKRIAREVKSRIAGPVRTAWKEAVNDLVQQQFHPHRFKFEQYWLKDEESDAIVARCWEKHCPGDAMHGVLSKISQCGSQLQKWGVLKRNQLRSSLMHKRATLKHVNEILSSNDWRQLRKIEKELEDLIRVDKAFL